MHANELYQGRTGGALSGIAGCAAGLTPCRLIYHHSMFTQGFVRSLEACGEEGEVSEVNGLHYVDAVIHGRHLVLLNSNAQGESMDC